MDTGKMASTGDANVDCQGSGGARGEAGRAGWGEKEGGRQVRRKRGGWSKGDGEGAGQGAETSRSCDGAGDGLWRGDK